jgi:glutamate transport system permease protein
VQVIIDALPTILTSFWLTIRLAFFSAIGSLTLGTILAVFRVSPVPVLRWIGALVVHTVRNTPLTLVMFFALFGLNYQLGVVFDDKYLYKNVFWLAVLALSVYTSSFVCEILRAGINTVPVGQAEAARAIGLTFTQNLRHVILPQAFRSVIAPLGSVMIAMTKNSTVAVTIGVVTSKGVYEASGQMRELMEAHGDLVPLIFLTFAIGFMVLTLPMGLITSWLATKLGVAR